MSKMIKCVIDSIRVSLTNQDRVVVLKQVDAERYLPIFIGLFESESLTIALQGVRTARPLTHNLLLETIKNLNAKLLRVEIVKVEQDVFFAQLVLTVEEKTVYVDCRPSDGLVLMALERVPLYIEENILLTAGIQPEDRKGHDVFSTFHEDETSEKTNLSDLKHFLDNFFGDDTGETKNADTESNDDSEEMGGFDFESYLESLDDEIDEDEEEDDDDDDDDFSSIEIDLDDDDDDNEDYDGGYPKEFFEEGLDDESIDYDDEDGFIPIEIEFDLEDEDDLLDFSEDDLLSIIIDDDEDEDEDDNDDDEPDPGSDGDDE